MPRLFGHSLSWTRSREGGARSNGKLTAKLWVPRLPSPHDEQTPPPPHDVITSGEQDSSDVIVRKERSEMGDGVAAAAQTLLPITATEERTIA